MATFLLPLLVLCPLAASLIIFISAGRMGARGAGTVACAGIGVAAVLSIIVSVILLSGPTGGGIAGNAVAMGTCCGIFG